MINRVEPVALPSREESEKCLLSCLLHNPGEVMKQCAHRIRPRSFSIPANSILYEIITEYPKKTKVDWNWLKQTLTDRKVLDEVGGWESVSALYDIVQGHENADFSINHILDAQRRRDGILMARDLERKFQDPEEDSQALLSQAQKDSLAISHGTNGLSPVINWETTGATTSSGYKDHKAIYPPDSILEDYMVFARNVSEAADAFILGSILPVCASQLARRVRFPFGSTVQFPNIFSMLVGPPGDRKSDAIGNAARIARDNLPGQAFLPENFSPESLFDEYDIIKDGRPDKLWVCDDANIVLTDWRQTQNGERNASRFLRLYDCGDLTESYRRNADKKQPVTKRRIEQTSTSICFGATPNIACFQGQAIRAGLARRFGFYVAEGHGNFHPFPAERDMEGLSEMFSRLNMLSANMSFSPEALVMWTGYQFDNRERLQQADSRNEALTARLSSEPMQTLKIAMIFEACRSAKQQVPLEMISKDTLRLAIEHIAQNLKSASYLDSIADREAAKGNAEILLSKIRKDFESASRNGSIVLPRTEITCKYAPHSSRQGTWTPNDIFLRFIPLLIRQGDAQLVLKKGKTEIYAFRDKD
jgi:hypothetical protein